MQLPYVLGEFQPELGQNERPVTGCRTSPKSQAEFPVFRVITEGKKDTGLVRALE